MNSGTNHTPSSTETIHDGEQASSGVSKNIDKLARRRLLVSSVGGGVALLAATSPIKALAQTSSCTKQCSISGMKSANHSFKPGECDPCGGYSPGWWGQHWRRDNTTPARPWPVGPQLSVKSVLTKSSLSDSISLFELMGNPEYASTEERHWVCAYLNSFAPPLGYKFPYTPQEVLNFYNGTGPYSPMEALQFFKDYMESHNS